MTWEVEPLYELPCQGRFPGLSWSHQHVEKASGLRQPVVQHRIDGAGKHVDVPRTVLLIIVRGCLERKPLYEKRLCHLQGKAKNELTG